MKSLSLLVPGGHVPRSELVGHGLRSEALRSWRVALYSHDTMGLGHTRRNVLIAQTLASCGLPLDILLIRGMGESLGVSLPAGVDCLTLPALSKQHDGSYSARNLSLDLAELVQLRAHTLQAALTAFAPDVLIVDNVPRGAQHELDSTLAQLRRTGRTRCVLGLRDILDSPQVVQREWQQAATQATISTYYDALWIYGDPLVYDAIKAYDFAPQIAARTSYVGYLDQRARLQYASQPLPLELPAGRMALCLLGGGQDGAELAEAFVRARFPDDMYAVLVTGPFMPPELRARLDILAAQQQGLTILSTADEPTQLLQHASKVVTMGGYNTVAELLSFEKQALVVPRVRPRQEQLIRAECLAALGMIDMLHPDQLSPQALSSWLAQPDKTPSVHNKLDMQGLSRLPHLLAELLGVKALSHSNTASTRDSISNKATRTLPRRHEDAKMHKLLLRGMIRQW